MRVRVVNPIALRLHRASAAAGGCGAHGRCDQSVRALACLTAREMTSLLAACFVIGLSAAPAPAAVSPYAVPGISPAGANDWHCRPGHRHPVPVILVHGTFQDMTLSWSYISPKLKGDGYCVFALDFGRRGTAPIERSALQLSRLVKHVLKATHASRVSIVGHSQGGLVARYYIKFLGGRRLVDDLVGIAPPNHGLNPGPIFTPYLQRLPACLQGACIEQVVNSQFLQKLNDGDQTPGPVAYTMIGTRDDDMVVPFTSTFLPAGPRTTNVLLQRACPTDHPDHLQLLDDPFVLEWVENALGRPGPADKRFRPRCAR
jgi:triacylglycerol lipase